MLAHTRWELRRAIKATNEVLNELRVIKHPDKTFIGRISRGFDFLGYRFTTQGLSVAQITLERFLEKVSRLYEHGASVGRIGEYVGRWWRWVRSRVDEVLTEGERERVCRILFTLPSLHVRAFTLP